MRPSITKQSLQAAVEKILQVTLCAIWYHLCNFKRVKNTNGGVFLSVQLQASAALTRSITPRWVVYTFFKSHK